MRGQVRLLSNRNDRTQFLRKAAYEIHNSLSVDTRSQCAVLLYLLTFGRCAWCKKKFHSGFRFTESAGADAISARFNISHNGLLNSKVCAQFLVLMDTNFFAKAHELFDSSHKKALQIFVSANVCLIEAGRLISFISARMNAWAL